MIPSSQEAKKWAIFCHLGGLLFLIGIPFANVLGPLILWLLKRDTHPYVNVQGKEALNFQITVLIGVILSAFLAIFMIGFFLVLLILIADVILIIQAAIAVSKGQDYRYPFSFRLVK
ncbi:MAG: DUF4870 domain-containing protein [Chlamydiota bacterium]